MKKEIGYDRRPRFGWSDSLDNDPQFIYESKRGSAGRGAHPVVVIPLPFMSPKLRHAMRSVAKQLWSGIPPQL